MTCFTFDSCDTRRCEIKNPFLYLNDNIHLGKIVPFPVLCRLHKLFRIQKDRSTSLNQVILSQVKVCKELDKNTLIPDVIFEKYLLNYLSSLSCHTPVSFAIISPQLTQLE